MTILFYFRKVIYIINIVKKQAGQAASEAEFVHQGEKLFIKKMDSLEEVADCNHKHNWHYGVQCKKKI